MFSNNYYGEVWWIKFAVMPYFPTGNKSFKEHFFFLLSTVMYNPEGSFRG